MNENDVIMAIALIKSKGLFPVTPTDTEISAAKCILSELFNKYFEEEYPFISKGFLKRMVFENNISPYKTNSIINHFVKLVFNLNRLKDALKNNRIDKIAEYSALISYSAMSIFKLNR